MVTHLYANHSQRLVSRWQISVLPKQPRGRRTLRIAADRGGDSQQRYGYQVEKPTNGVTVKIDSKYSRRIRKVASQFPAAASPLRRTAQSSSFPTETSGALVTMAGDEKLTTGGGKTRLRVAKRDARCSMCKWRSLHCLNGWQRR